MTESWRLTPQAAPGAPWPWVLPGMGAALAWLRGFGAAPGARVGVIAQPGPALVSLLQAAAWGGIDLVLFHHRWTAAESAAVIADAQCTWVLELPADGFPDRDPPPPAAGGALIVYTSGSSGPPKAVRLPWPTVRAAAGDAVRYLELDHDEPWLVCLPPAHIGGVMAILRSAVSGAPLLLLAQPDPALITAAFSEGTVRAASLVPTLLHRLITRRAGQPFTGSPRILIGGAPCPPALVTTALGLGLVPCTTWGMSETAAMVCCQRRCEAGQPGTGSLLPGMEVALQDANSEGIGVLRVRGTHLAAGYEHGGRLVTPFAAQAWFATGDLGRINGERIEVIGRRDELIISGGENVSPAAVEAVLQTHPAIADAAVVGIADAEWGQIVAAALVARTAPPDDTAFRRWLDTVLSPANRPRRWRWVAAVPRNSQGKIIRNEVVF